MGIARQLGWVIYLVVINVAHGSEKHYLRVRNDTVIAIVGTLTRP